jgi:hypothetical protein
MVQLSEITSRGLCYDSWLSNCNANVEIPLDRRLSRAYLESLVDKCFAMFETAFPIFLLKNINRYLIA